MSNTVETEDKLARARESAKATMDSISEMVAKLRAAEDDDAFEELAPDLARAAGFTVSENRDTLWSWGRNGETDEELYAEEETAWRMCCEDNGLRPDVDEARQKIEEDPLSVQVRSGWCSPGETMQAEEFEILLGTGGPAVRIIGELDNGQPTRARLECQDWFVPWTEVFNVSHDDLLAYSQCFYFGE